MENVFETENIILDYSEDRKERDLDVFRLSLFDKNGHYNDEIHLSLEHLIDLADCLKKIDFDKYDNSL